MTTDNREQQRAAIDVAIQPKTERAVSVIMPIEISDELKIQAKAKGRFFRPYIASLLLLGMKAEQKGDSHEQD